MHLDGSVIIHRVSSKKIARKNITSKMFLKFPTIFTNQFLGIKFPGNEASIKPNYL